jgi:hypothetical protein
MNLDSIGQVVAFVLTLLVFSYLIGDNPFYRVAIHMFLGVASAYAVIVVCQAVIFPQIQLMLNAVLASDWITVALLAVPWVLGLLLLFRTSASLAPLGNVAVAVMVGVGAALAVGGAITGTLIPQILSVLLYFFYLGRKNAAGRGERPGLTKPIAAAGQFFLSTALAALYAGALAAYFAIFVERVGFLYEALVKALGALNIKL